MAEKVLMKGNEAIAEAAIMAGCRHYFGYPITPQTEVAAYMAKRMPKIEGGTFLQPHQDLPVLPGQAAHQVPQGRIQLPGRIPIDPADLVLCQQPFQFPNPLLKFPIHF